jgi:acyl carrier protein
MHTKAKAQTVAGRVMGVIAFEMGITRDLERTDNLEQDFGADSLDMVEITMGIEEEFGIEIPDEDVDGWHTVDAVIGYVEGRLKS